MKISDMAVFITEQMASADPPDRFTVIRDDGARPAVLDVVPAGEGAAREVDRLVRDDLSSSTGVVHYRLLAEYSAGAVKAEKAYRRRGLAPAPQEPISAVGRVEKSLVTLVGDVFTDVREHNAQLFAEYKLIISEQHQMIREMGATLQELVRDRGGEIDPAQKFAIERLASAAATALPALAPLVLGRLGAARPAEQPAQPTRYGRVRKLIDDLSDAEIAAIGKWLQESGGLVEVFQRLSEEHQNRATELVEEFIGSGGAA